MEEDYDKVGFRECVKRCIERLMWNGEFLLEFCVLFVRKIVMLDKI